MEQSKVYIYGLASSKTPEDFKYIGKTIHLRERELRHISEAVSGKISTYKNNWINSVIDGGDSVILKVIEICDEDNWKERERYWISEYRNKTDKLTNYCDGGEGYSAKGEKNHRFGKIGPESTYYGIRKENILPPLKVRRYHPGKSVRAYNLDGTIFKEWNSVREASEELGANHHVIRHLCKGRQKTYWGFTWEYIDKKIDNILKLNNNGEILETYKTLKEAAADVNGDTRHIHYAINKGIEKFGFYWKLNPSIQ